MTGPTSGVAPGIPGEHRESASPHDVPVLGYQVKHLQPAALGRVNNENSISYAFKHRRLRRPWQEKVSMENLSKVLYPMTGTARAAACGSSSSTSL